MRTIPSQRQTGYIGWLAGIIDGEGSILLKVSPTYGHIIYGLTIINTNLEMLERCQKIIIQMCRILKGDPPNIRKKLYRSNNLGTTNPKQCYELKVARQRWLRQVLKYILPYLTEKKAIGQELYNYLTNNEYGKSYETRYRPPNDKRYLADRGVETKRPAP